MIGEVLTGIMGVAFLAGAVMQFRCKGPIWSAEYLAADAAGRRKMQTKQEYICSAIGCMYIGILFLLTMIYTLTEIRGFLYVIFGFSGLLFLHIVYGIFHAVEKSRSKEEKKQRSVSVQRKKR